MILIPIKTVSEMNVRCHWAQRAWRAKQHRLAGFVMTPAHEVPCVVTMTRLSPGELDDDNIRSALKGLRDGIADRLGVKDNDKRVRWVYEQAKCRRGEYGVRVEITPTG